jgi:hypothetical protein
MKRLVITMSIVLGAAASSLTLCASAQACSPAACGPQIVLPTRFGSVYFPSNAVFIATGGGYPGPTLPRIFDASGAVVPASGKKPSVGRATVFSPDADLPPGDYALEYDPRCLPAAGSPAPVVALAPLPKPSVVAFRVGPPVAPPTTAGTLTVVERGTIGESGGRSFVRLRLDASEGMSAYMHSASWSVMVDGKPFLALNSVAAPPDYLTLECVPGGVAPPVDSCGFVRDVASGSHRVVMSAFVAGLDQPLAPAELTVDVSCDTVGGQDAASETGALAASDDGCAVASGVPTLGGLLVALASMIALRARRRSRRG